MIAGQPAPVPGPNFKVVVRPQPKVSNTNVKDVLLPQPKPVGADALTTGLIDLDTLSQVRQSAIDAMSFAEIDDFINRGVNCISLHLVSITKARKAMRPAILRVRDVLSSQGMRTDLLDAPPQLTFDAWIKSKANLGSRATLYRLLAASGMPQKQLTEGAKVRDAGSGEMGIVEHTCAFEGGVPKVEVLFQGERKAKTVPVADLVKVSVRKIAIGDLFIFVDRGEEYRYDGDGKFLRTETPPIALHKKAHEVAKLQEKKKAKAKKKALHVGQHLRSRLPA